MNSARRRSPGRAAAVSGTSNLCPGCIMPSNKVLPWSEMRTQAGAVAVSTTGPCAAAVGGACRGCCCGVTGASVAAGAAVGGSSLSERLRIQEKSRTATMIAAIAPITSQRGIARVGSAGS